MVETTAHREKLGLGLHPELYMRVQVKYEAFLSVDHSLPVGLESFFKSEVELSSFFGPTVACEAGLLGVELANHLCYLSNRLCGFHNNNNNTTLHNRVL